MPFFSAALNMYLVSNTQQCQKITDSGNDREDRNKA